MLTSARFLMLAGLILLIPSGLLASPLAMIVPKITPVLVPFVPLWKVGAPIGTLGLALYVLPRIGRLFGFTQAS